MGPRVECKQGHLVRLDLSGSELRQVPESLSELTWLEKLGLKQNQLKSIPESLGSLTRLRNLYLNDNQLESIPESLGNLTQLTWLDLRHNQLKSIPESLGSLTRLWSLDLSENRLESIPESIKRLTKLMSLDLNDNRLKSIPESLGSLMELTWLGLEHNQLESIPESMGSLTRLERFFLNDNQLESIPESLGCLTQLMWLHLNHNRLESIPESLGSLMELTWLGLSHNRLESIPESLGNLTRLKRFNVRRNQLKSIPESLGSLTQLTWFDLSHNQLESIPESLGSLTRLEMLYLNDNWLEGIPEALGSLTRLARLHLSRNRLESIPESLGSLARLSRFHLSDNRLQSIPESMGSLTQLTWLDLSHNRLESIPDSLGSLTQLTGLDLRQNRLKSIQDWLGSLTWLRHLYLSDNRMESIPESLGSLTRLEQLYLSNNWLKSIPQSLGSLTRLGWLDLNDNQLTSIPESLGSLTMLMELDLRSNRFAELPDAIGRLGSLEVLQADRNFLTELPQSLGQLANLKRLHLQHNKLQDFVAGPALPSLEVLLLQSNRLQAIEQFCQLRNLTTLYLHKNHLSGRIPPCLSALSSLRVLTLHENRLTGEIPRGLPAMRFLKVLTLHQNKLSGRIPADVGSFAQLAFLSVHANALTGPVPELNLTDGCTNDDSFSMIVEHATFGFKEFTCAGPILPFLWTTQKQKQMFQDACPERVHTCEKASARGPTLLLHGNRLSCGAPRDVTAVPESLRSLVVIGNMLGDPSMKLPAWVAKVEQQPFLYVSISTLRLLCWRLAALALLFAGAWRLVLGSWRHLQITEALEDEIEISHRFLVTASGLFAPLALVLFCLYVFGSFYYDGCGDDFLKSTAAYFQSPECEPWLGCTWSVWSLGSAWLLRHVPKPKEHRGARPGRPSAKTSKALWWIVWLGLVLLLSAPSMAYAFMSTLPQQNQLLTRPWVLWAVKNQAALVMMLVDMLVTPKLAAMMSQRSRINRSMLLMAARTATMWLNAALYTIYLSEHCQRGWTRYWNVCNVASEEYKQFNISLGEHQLLEPVADLCGQNDRWWATDACARSVVGTLAPLLLSKMIQRALLQPVITVVLWKLSVKEDGSLYFTPLRFLGVRWKMCTSRNLDRAQQATFLVTLAEVLLIWAPLIPLLLPTTALAVVLNLRVFRVGQRVFGAEVPKLEEGETASMSRKYMMASVVVLLIFQNWFVWTSEKSGRWLLSLASCLAVGLMGSMASTFGSSGATEEESVELATLGPSA